MICNEMIIEVNDGRVNNPQPFRNFLHELGNGTYNVRFTPRNVRSLKLNAYYHAVLIPLVKQGLRDAGYDEVKTSDDTHEVLKALFNKKNIVNKNTGEVLTIPGSTRELTSREFNDYMEEIGKWAAEFLGIAIPAPGQSQLIRR